MKPTIRLASAAQMNADKRKGLPVPFRLTIMHSPSQERGEMGCGRVRVLTPTDDEWRLGRPLIEARRLRRPVDPVALAAYCGAMEARWATADLSPGALTFDAYVGHHTPQPVPDGCVLICACSAAHAAAGECHRAWSAPFLVRAGWRVLLDGVEVPDV